ncbi:hypothetical protein HN766_20325 [Candidatus Poribacteria bacterium]|jgi:hypothetical protein|nr:hypothetical protein [Candidatus Poribacteria bacterium]
MAEQLAEQVDIAYVKSRQVWLIRDDRAEEDVEVEVGVVLGVDGDDIDMLYVDMQPPFFGEFHCPFRIGAERLIQCYGDVDISSRPVKPEDAPMPPGFVDGMWVSDTIYTDIEVGKDDIRKIIGVREIARQQNDAT